MAGESLEHLVVAERQALRPAARRLDDSFLQISPIAAAIAGLVAECPGVGQEGGKLGVAKGALPAASLEAQLALVIGDGDGCLHPDIGAGGLAAPDLALQNTRLLLVVSQGLGR